MRGDITVAPRQESREDPPQIKVLQGKIALVAPHLPRSNWYPLPPWTQTITSDNTSTNSLPDSASSDCLRFIKNNKNSDIMDFIKFAAKRRHNIDPVNIDFTEADKAESTIRQYNSAFRKFAKFIRGESCPDVP